MSPGVIAAQPIPSAATSLTGPAPATTKKRRGNPNLALAPRCGAAPAPAAPAARRPSGASSAAACMAGGAPARAPRRASPACAPPRTIHGRYSAQARAHERHMLAVFRRGQVLLAAVRCRDRLPPELAARLNRMPPVLMPPPFASEG